MQFVMPVYVLSSIVLGGTEVSGSEEQDPACDLALIFGLFFIQTWWDLKVQQTDHSFPCL